MMFKWPKRKKHFKVIIEKGDADQWCSLYIGKTLIVKPFINSVGIELDWLYSVVKCKENKQLLAKDIYISTYISNAWGINLSVRSECVSIVT